MVNAHSSRKMASAAWQRRWIALYGVAVAAVALGASAYRATSGSASLAINPEVAQVFGTAGQSVLNADTSSILLRLALAAMLGAGIAVWRRLSLVEIQAHMVITFTGAMMMVIIGNELVRAFGLLGAGSIVRYRTPVRDPQSLASLFVSMGIGIAVGVGLFELALIATALVLLFQGLAGRIGASLPTGFARSQRTYDVDLLAEDPAAALEQTRALFRAQQIGYSLTEFELARKDKPAKLGFRIDLTNGTSTEELTALLMRQGVLSVSFKEERE